MIDLNPNPSRVIWITGLSGAGKSTLSVEVATRLRNWKQNVILLDGDELREVFETRSEDSKTHARNRELFWQRNMAAFVN